MEWVETTAETIEEAKSLALDQLGVDESDAEFEILEEPRAGLFGLEVAFIHPDAVMGVLLELVQPGGH